MRNCLIFVLILMSGCVGVENYNFFTPQQLNGESEKYNNQEIYVKGYVDLGTNARDLVESKSRYRKANELWEKDAPKKLQEKYKNDCLTLLNASLLMENKKLFSGKTLIFKGILIKEYMTKDTVDLQACTETTSAFILDEKFIVDTYLKKTEKKNQ